MRAENCKHGLPEKEEVERDRPVLDVVKIKPDPLFPGEVAAPANLPETSNPRLDK